MSKTFVISAAYRSPDEETMISVEIKWYPLIRISGEIGADIRRNWIIVTDAGFASNEAGSGTTDNSACFIWNNARERFLRVSEVISIVSNRAGVVLETYVPR